METIVKDLLPLLNSNFKLNHTRPKIDYLKAFAAATDDYQPNLTVPEFIDRVLQGHAALSECSAMLDPEIERLAVVIKDAIAQIETTFPEFYEQRTAIKEKIFIEQVIGPGPN